MLMGQLLTPPLSRRLASVSKRICELGGWNVSNLRLQKLLYLCQMLHLGQTNVPLIEENFEAWMYGPVVPQLYRKMKVYGASPVEDRFYNAMPLEPLAEANVKSICEGLKEVSDTSLVAITHDGIGAWAKNYRPDERGVVIRTEDILDEYRARAASQQ